MAAWVVGSRRIAPDRRDRAASVASWMNSAAAAAGRCYCAPVPAVERTPAHATICNNLLTLLSKRLLLQDRCNGRVNRLVRFGFLFYKHDDILYPSRFILLFKQTCACMLLYIVEDFVIYLRQCGINHYGYDIHM